jgi:hypothetical protein
VEKTAEQATAIEAGLAQFLQDARLSGDATEAEIEFLKSLKLRNKRPTPLYYYRELQNLRDPLHFEATAARATEEPALQIAVVPRSRKARPRS